MTSQVLLVPVSFVSEHIETLYELDILYRDVAEEVGLPALSPRSCIELRPDFIDALAGLVARRIAADGERKPEGFRVSSFELGFRALSSAVESFVCGCCPEPKPENPKLETRNSKPAHMDRTFREAVVIGAGISGPVCAYRLKTLGVDVALIEKSDRVGGVIQSERIGDYLIERGPNSSQGTEELRRSSKNSVIYIAEGDPSAGVCRFNGRLHPVPRPAHSQKRSAQRCGKLRIPAELFVKTRSLIRGERLLLCPSTNRQRSSRTTCGPVRVRDLRRRRTCASVQAAFRLRTLKPATAA
jgi:hypothetical protein